MKKLYFYLLALLSLFFLSCEVITGEHRTDVFLTNQLESVVDLEIFKGEETLNFNLNPNDTTYLTTIEYIMRKDVRYFQFPGDVAYFDFLSSFDSVHVVYNNNKFTYYKNDENLGNLFYYTVLSGKGWIVNIDETKKQILGWE
jgi:hypothetical protein